MKTEEQPEESSQVERNAYQDIRSLLSGYLDGTLREGELIRVGDHLETCESCRLAYEKLEKTVEVNSLVRKVSSTRL